MSVEKILINLNLAQENIIKADAFYKQAKSYEQGKDSVLTLKCLLKAKEYNNKANYYLNKVEIIKKQMAAEREKADTL